ncbi:MULTISPECIES: flagellar biosynthetic protein FliO [Kosakonia]|uniref:flagellar biosynthetic protein FliO n=1 Tax=Kosakonia TaxID=1330547 RepID=UPI0008C34B9D|nr:MULTISPECIES: flagellar biosynthetic protein FliO [Kosakonia]APG19343.1 flagellar biosynthetic protein FliO [Kosakonia radicincitans]NCF08038.1 flagellar biosynthetic protein FliO [Kosakonia sp. MH5]SET60512.1 flagellar protein FliO/FliZ [Kosakonia radicincitans]VVT46428.1 Flagellar biosynthesis protein FliO [Kosakonia radicincitans]
MNTGTLNTVAPHTTEAATFPISMGNIVGSLALVLVMIVAVAWILRRTGVVSRVAKGHNLLAVKHSQSIGSRERLVVVEVDDKWLLLGVTQQSITPLMTMEKQECSTAMPVVSDFQASLLRCFKQRAARSQS